MTMIAQSPALWIFEDDVLNRSGRDWMSAHISLGKPLHRYEGTITITENSLLLQGFDNRQKVEISFEILKGQMEQLYHGFDKSFTALETRSLGTSWYPLRITFQNGGESKNVYLIINYRFGKTDNLEYFEFLKQWVS
jgi:hypothetical protein